MRAAFYLSDDDGATLHHVVGMPLEYALTHTASIIVSRHRESLVRKQAEQRVTS